MQIQNIFAKPIQRDINGVIKVGQSDHENIQQELEEYVVTRELLKHFTEFFANYKKGWLSPTDKMGVWISGFFGSGKSHFLKILSYLLENKEVNNKHAIDYFIDDNKIVDQMVLADMQLCADKADNTEVILFNIDSKSDQNGKNNKNAIVAVFLKVFNEMQGFYGASPYIADLERHLYEEGRYDEFKDLFKKEYGGEWLDSRHKIDFVQDYVVDVLNNMDFMSEAASRNLFEKAAVSTYDISIEAFAKMVDHYIKQKGNNHHVVFLVDEIGQYIGTDSKLMLNLQTITEDLGTYCQGKAWVIVTSQQDIDAITKDMGLRSNDFSKIRGRFDTQLSLSSANVDEVIKKRILEKNETAKQTLGLIYGQKDTIIKNLIVFNDGVEKKLYSSEQNFIDIYPFVPYQFNLLASVLTSIRTHGASGKSLSEGERSMLALFKESADDRKEKEVGELIPFSLFYDALDKFLENTHSSVIIRAYDNNYINPSKEKNCFPVEVLKALFLVKYINDIKTNVDNIVSLMVDNIDTDRIDLKEKVEKALKILLSQNLIQKNGDTYEFLTNDEQVINQDIDRQSIEMAEVTRKISEIIFEDMFSDKRYRYDKHNGRYTFAFNQIVDDQFYRGNQNNDIGVHILTTNSDERHDTELRMRSGQKNEVLVVLPEDRSFIDEIQTYLKIEKYLRDTSNPTLNKNEHIKALKGIEMRRRLEDAKVFLREALKEAVIYVNGAIVQIGAKDVPTRINDALSRLVDIVYNKLYYIEVAFTENDIRNLLQKSAQQSLDLEGKGDPNLNALKDVLGYISLNSASHAKTSMKSLLERFMKVPYGFVEDDVEWLVAKLFKDRSISFTLNGAPITQQNKSVDEIVRIITKKEFVEKLMIEKREQVNEIQKRDVKEVMKELFGVSGAPEDDDAMMYSFQNYAQKQLATVQELIRACEGKPYPGKKILLQGKELLQDIVQMQQPSEFFKEISKRRNDFLNFAEDYECVHNFFDSNQKKFFDEALEKLALYENGKVYINDKELEKCVSVIKNIIKKQEPYKDISNLPELIKKFVDAYQTVFDSMSEPVYTSITSARTQVIQELERKQYKNELLEAYNNKFMALKEKADRTNDVVVFQGIKLEVDTQKSRLFDEMNERDRKLAKEALEQNKQQPPNNNVQVNVQNDKTKTDAVVVTEKVPEIKHLSIKSVNTGGMWHIKDKNDVDAHIEELRERLYKEICEGIIINIMFE